MKLTNAQIAVIAVLVLIFGGLGEYPFETHPCSTLRLLAAIYADHPEFREEWPVSTTKERKP